MDKKQDVLDIIFEGRNKAYGAYELRNLYPKHVRKATLIGSLLLLLLFLIPFITGIMKSDDAEKKVRVIDITQLEQPPSIDQEKPPPPPVEPPPPPVRPSIKFVPPVIKKDEDVREEEIPPKVDELKDIDPGRQTVEGDKNAPVIYEDVVVKDPGIGTAKPVVVEKPKEPEIFTFVEQMPEFPGGVQEMYKYLAKNIRYPAIARENNITGRVIVRFVVAEDGRVSNVEVVKGIGGGCDEEARRVIAGMPSWKAGKQNGRPVKVYYTMPVIFKLE
jgi:periplasmic protein TonB